MAIPYRLYKMLTLFSLYLVQGIPSGLFFTLIPYIMRREGIPLEIIGATLLMKLPAIIKFLWAPFIDRKTQAFKANKRVILLFELAYALSIAGLAFTKFEQGVNMLPILILLMLSIIWSSSQDIATDALASRILNNAQERSIGNGIQTAGRFAGTLISGVLLMLYDYVGWQWLMILCALMVLLALIPLIFFKNDPSYTFTSKTRVPWHAFITFFKGQALYLCFLVFAYGAISSSLVLYKLYMTDLSYTTKELGLFFATLGPSIAIVVSLATGILSGKTRMKLIGKRSIFKPLLLAMALQCVGIICIALFKIYPEKGLLHFGLFSTWASYAMTSASIYTLAMSKVRMGHEGTDFTIQISISQLSMLLMAATTPLIVKFFQDDQGTVNYSLCALWPLGFLLISFCLTLLCKNKLFHEK